MRAFKAGEISAGRVFNAETWATQYDFPAVQRGEIVKSTFPHQKPSGMTGFVMNTRRAPFDDWRVREALIQAFNFEYINETLTAVPCPVSPPISPTPPLPCKPAKRLEPVSTLLAPFSDTLPPGTLDGYALPVSDGSARNRRGIRAAMKLLEDAGYSAADGTMRGPDGNPLNFSILVSKGSAQDFSNSEKAAQLYVQALERLGIDARVEIVDSAQVVERLDQFDFDITTFRRALSLSPGNEQKFYWGVRGRRSAGLA